MPSKKLIEHIKEGLNIQTRESTKLLEATEDHLRNAGFDIIAPPLANITVNLIHELDGIPDKEGKELRLKTLAALFQSILGEAELMVEQGDEYFAQDRD